MSTKRTVPAGAGTMQKPAEGKPTGETVAVKTFTGGYPKGTHPPASAEPPEAEDKADAPPAKKTFAGMSDGIAKFAAGIKLPK